MKNIIKVLEVVDTREWIEVEDERWIAMPGSGTTLQCESCGRDHEVHATVLLDDKTTAVVGTGCAQGSEFAKALRSGATKAKTTARLRAELVATKARLASTLEIIEQVATLELPAVTQDGIVFSMGSATVWCRDGFTSERSKTLESSWRRGAARDLGAGNAQSISQQVANLETRLAKRI